MEQVWQQENLRDRLVLHEKVPVRRVWCDGLSHIVALAQPRARMAIFCLAMEL